MKTLLKVLAAVALMAGVCFAVYELFRRWDENQRNDTFNNLKGFINKGLRKKENTDTIADYRDEDDDFFDDDFFADLDGSAKVEVEIDTADEDEAPVSFDLSEEALEQLLDN